MTVTILCVDIGCIIGVSYDRQVFINLKYVLDLFKVLRFNDVQEKQKFHDELKTYLGDHNIPTVEENMQEHVLLNNSYTKEKRDEMLQNFFRDAIKAVIFMLIIH